jgi:hypothetical protein
MNDRDGTADWLLSVHGRIARIVVGSLLIILGLGIIGGFLGVLLLIIGAIPIASAAYGSLLIGPLFGRDIHGRRPEQQSDESEDAEEAPEPDDDDDEPRDEDRSDDEPRKEPDPEWSAPPLARAERPEGQGPRTKDLRADEPEG